MIDLLILYWPTLLAAAAAASALSLAGAFLVTRQAGVQVLAVSQGAGLGISLGLLLSALFFTGHAEHTLLPMALGLLSSGIAFSATSWIAHRSHSPVAVHLAAFALLWGLSQLVTGFFPAVESHAIAVYFGDVVTLTRGESFLFLTLGLSALLYLTANARKLADRAFLASILEERASGRNAQDLGFYAGVVLLLCLSVQLLGLLFSLSCLFVPTTLYSFSPKVGVMAHLRRVAFSAGLAAALGFSYSLADSRVLTTPAITLSLALLPLLNLAGEKAFFRCK